MEKILKVNTSMLDMISTKAEAIEAYDQIKINCSMCLTTEKSRQLLSQGKININCSNMIGVSSEEVKIMNINGFKEISADFVPPKEPTVLIVNGALVIDDGEKKNLDQYENVIVNGVVLHPMSFDTSNFNVNGALIPYPDGAILIFQSLQLTNSFINSAVQGATYFVQGIPEDIGNLGDIGSGDFSETLKNNGIQALEPLDLELLKKKDLHFYTSWITTIEENAEQLMKRVEGFIGNTVVPAGYKIMKGGRLDSLAIRRFGKKIYVDGNLEITAEDAGALAAVEALQVAGTVTISDDLADAFFEKTSNYGDVRVYKGEWEEIFSSDYILNNELLESMENGVTFNCIDAEVEILPEVSLELLAEKVHKIILKNSRLKLNLKQQTKLRKKIENIDGEVVVAELVKEPEVEVQKEMPKFIETKINCSSYKL